MATSRGQTHQKRVRETERREKRERKQAKKALRAAGELPAPDDAEKEPGDGEQDAAAGWIQ